MMPRQLNQESSGRRRDTPGDLDQALSKAIDLPSARYGSLRSEAQFLEENVGNSREQDPELIGVELRAADSIQVEADFGFLDSILAIAAHHELRIQLLSAACHVGDDIANVVARLPTVVLNHLRLEQDTTSLAPCFRGVSSRAAENRHGLVGSFERETCPVQGTR